MTLLRPITSITILSMCLASAAGAGKQAAPPDTEIFLASLTAEGERFELGALVNISNHPGYDNQPSFTPDGRTILFASARAASPTPPRGPATDIHAYDLASSSVRQITSTPESEYSPTITPDGRHLSVIRVEQDGTQRVWRFTRDGREPSLVLPDIKPVGYHVWIDRTHLALFVLGEPPTLRVAEIAGGTKLAATGIGRSLQRIPNGGISYVKVENEAPGKRSLTIMELDPATSATRALIAAPAGATEADVAWTPDGTLLTGHAGTLHAWRRGRASWTAAADLAALGLHDVSRLAVSPAGDRIAIVASPQRR